MLTSTKSRKSQRGAAALEFALVVPVLIVLIMGIVDFGMVMNAQSVVANAAREGARTAALGETKASAETATKSAMSVLTGATNPGTKATATCKTAAGAACSFDDTTPDTGGTAIVTVIYVHTWLSPAILGLSSTATITQASQMRIE